MKQAEPKFYRLYKGIAKENRKIKGKVEFDKALIDKRIYRNYLVKLGRKAPKKTNLSLYVGAVMLLHGGKPNETVDMLEFLHTLHTKNIEYDETSEEDAKHIRQVIELLRKNPEEAVKAADLFADIIHKEQTSENFTKLMRIFAGEPVRRGYEMKKLVDKTFSLKAKLKRKILKQTTFEKNEVQPLLKFLTVGTAQMAHTLKRLRKKP